MSRPAMMFMHAFADGTRAVAGGSKHRKGNKDIKALPAPSGQDPIDPGYLGI